MFLTVDLLGLLNWVSDRGNVGSNLQALMKVEGEEVVKFLQDVLDTLFNILMSNPDSNIHDDMVFNCLVRYYIPQCCIFIASKFIFFFLPPAVRHRISFGQEISSFSTGPRFVH